MVCSFFRFFSLRKKNQRLKALQTWWCGGGQLLEVVKGRRGELKIEDTRRGKG